MLKLPRTIWLDPSDTFVFERAAEPGEWAVSGAFVFWNQDPVALGSQGARGAGVFAFSASTVRLVDARHRDRGERSGTRDGGRAPQAKLLENSARRILPPRGGAAEEEVAFAASLRDHAPQTLLAVQRSVEDGEIRERFRTLRLRETAGGADSLHAHASAFTFTRSRGDEEPGAEEADLMGFTKADRMTRDRT